MERGIAFASPARIPEPEFADRRRRAAAAPTAARLDGLLVVGRSSGRRDMLTRFTRALYRAQQWLARAAAADVATLIAPAFPDLAPDVRQAAVARYLAQATWAADPILRAPGYEYLPQILLAGVFITRSHPDADLIDVSIATEVVGRAAAEGETSL